MKISFCHLKEALEKIGFKPPKQKKSTDVDDLEYDYDIHCLDELDRLKKE